MKRIDEYLDTKINKDTEEYLDYNEPPITMEGAHRKLGYGIRDVFQKMDKWHNGERKENLKLCSDAKLIVFWEACGIRKYYKEQEKIEAEANRRGWTFEKLNKK